MKKIKKGEAEVVGVHSADKPAHVLGGHIDRNEETLSQPASGSVVPARKLNVPFSASAMPAKELQHNNDTLPSQDKRVSTYGHLHGMDVIMPSGE